MGNEEMKIERKSSIENEPRTLSLEQIHYARGLEPVLGVGNMKVERECGDGDLPGLMMSFRDILMTFATTKTNREAAHIVLHATIKYKANVTFPKKGQD
ncbi:hypothetical protein AXF42_Ash002443 [Apostasia shenzhenica]|uniref:Uncharacterized protein n=1 Tax=Apostasia shenzhenica TaxID=1088818 RepID=A0A2I0ANJ8_9ASPA|nr:hypothetical protein AXF42_Ash002443 [Apostasia shenzhenica]